MGQFTECKPGAAKIKRLVYYTGDQHSQAGYYATIELDKKIFSVILKPDEVQPPKRIHK